MTRKVCIAGATGWACAALTKAVHAQTDMQVAGAVSRTRKGEKLTIRHDAGTSAQPYVDGALLAIRKVDTFIGLRRGMDHVMDLD